VTTSKRKQRLHPRRQRNANINRLHNRRRNRGRYRARLTMMTCLFSFNYKGR
jgi:hypothetical protein